MFMACPNLENVQMGGAIESIGRGAFSGCTNLKSIDLTGVKRIDALAFVDHEIEEFTLPPTLERIGQGALRPNIYYHRHPTKVWSQISNPAAVTYLTPWGDTATGYVIYDFPSSWYGSPATLYVPRGTKAKYEALPSWKNSFAAIEETDYDHVDALSAGTKTDKQWHTLQGTDVSNPTRPGIYINGNRKKIVK